MDFLEDAEYKKKIKAEKKYKTDILDALVGINNKEEIDYSETLQEIKKIVDEKSIDLSEVISTIKGIKLEQKEVDLSGVIEAIKNIPKPEKIEIPKNIEDTITHSFLGKILSKIKIPEALKLDTTQFKDLIESISTNTKAIKSIENNTTLVGGGGKGYKDVGLKNTTGDKINPSTETKQDEIITGLEKLKQDFSVRNKEETVDYKFVGFEILGSGDWKIMRIDLNSTEMETLYAVGTSDYATNWADRLTINYN